MWKSSLGIHCSRRLQHHQRLCCSHPSAAHDLDAEHEKTDEALAIGDFLGWYIVRVPFIPYFLLLFLDVAVMEINRIYNRVSVVAVARIITLTHLELANITGTMVWVDFLSTLEVNLGIICVSLPMLGPLVARWNKTRGASKLGNYNQSERSGQSGSKLSSRKKQPGPDTIALHSIYDHGDDTNHAAAAFAPEEQSPSASETNLSPQKATSALDRPGANRIVVESRWEIKRS
jgi:hypothetical protein